MTTYPNRLVEYYERNDRSFWTSKEGVTSSEIRYVDLPGSENYAQHVAVLRAGGVFSTAYNVDLFFKHVEANLEAQDYLERNPDRTMVDAYKTTYQPAFGHGPDQVHHIYPKAGDPAFPEAAIDGENLAPTLNERLQVGSGEPAHLQMHRTTDNVVYKKTALPPDLTPEGRASLVREVVHMHIPYNYVKLEDVKEALDRYWERHNELDHPGGDPSCPLCREREQSERERDERERAEREAEARETAEREARENEAREKEERAAQEREADDPRDAEREAERAERVEREEAERRAADAERHERDRAEGEASERREAQEAARRDAEAAEAREAADRRAAEQVEREERERAERESAERHETEQAARREAEETERLERELAEREQTAREEAEREQTEREQAEREQAERLEAEAAEREAADATERAAAEQAERQAAEATEMVAEEPSASVADQAAKVADAAGVDATGVAEVTGGFDGGTVPFGVGWRD